MPFPQEFADAFAELALQDALAMEVRLREAQKKVEELQDIRWENVPMETIEEVWALVEASKKGKASTP
jgi:hypothetical protein